MAWTTPRTWTDGELVTAAIMNPHVRDNFNALGEHLIARKTSDQASNTQTMAAVTSMTMPVSASEVWKFHIDLRFNGDTASDLAYRFTFPTGGDIRTCALTLIADGTTVQWADVQGTSSPTGSSSIACDGAGTHLSIPVDGVYVNGANSGNVVLEFAKQAAGGTGVTVEANTTWWAVKLA